MKIFNKLALVATMLLGVLLLPIVAEIGANTANLTLVTPAHAQVYIVMPPQGGTVVHEYYHGRRWSRVQRSWDSYQQQQYYQNSQWQYCSSCDSSYYGGSYCPNCGNYNGNRHPTGSWGPAYDYTGYR